MSRVAKHRNEETAPLREQRCEACEGGIPALSPTGITALKSALDEGWRVVDGKVLTRRFGFRNFAEALAFTNKVGALAEEQGHHPDIALGWGKVEITLYTHAVNALTRNDFILAAQIDAQLEN